LITIWLQDEGNPVSAGYSGKKDKGGTKNKFAAFTAENCKK